MGKAWEMKSKVPKRKKIAKKKTEFFPNLAADWIFLFVFELLLTAAFVESEERVTAWGVELG